MSFFMHHLSNFVSLMCHKILTPFLICAPNECLVKMKLTLQLTRGITSGKQK
jgi:hypothetical protein